MKQLVRLFIGVLLASFIYVGLGGVTSAQDKATDAKATPAFTRTVLQKVDTSVPGREAVQITAEFPAGVGTGKHTHPGEEVGYVLQGPFTFEVAGKPPMTLKTGDHFFVPAGTIHEGKNSGNANAKVLVTYILEKGKPLATPAK